MFYRSQIIVAKKTIHIKLPITFHGVEDEKNRGFSPGSADLFKAIKEIKETFDTFYLVFKSLMCAKRAEPFTAETHLPDLFMALIQNDKLHIFYRR